MGMGSLATDDQRRERGVLPTDPLFASAWVVQARAEDILDIQVNQQQILLEGFGACDQLALAVEDNAIAVEDQLILPADEITVSDDGAGIRCAGSQHALASGLLAD